MFIFFSSGEENDGEKEIRNGEMREDEDGEYINDCSNSDEGVPSLHDSSNNSDDDIDEDHDTGNSIEHETTRNEMHDGLPPINLNSIPNRRQIFNVAIIIIPRPPRNEQDRNQNIDLDNNNINVNIENNVNNPETNDESNSNGVRSEENRTRESLSRALVFFISLRGDGSNDLPIPGDSNSFEDIINQLFLNYHPNSPPPASEKAVNACPIISFDESHTKDECCICKEFFRIQDFGMELPCKHLYHKDCITPWLQKNNTCPLCRHQLEPETETNTTDSQTDNIETFLTENHTHHINNQNNENTNHIDDEIPPLEEESDD